MSGEIANKFIQEDNFSRLINAATVDLDDASTEDLIFVKFKIEEFVKLTGSELGQRILTNWQKEHQKIIRVFPKDYKRAFAEQEEAHWGRLRTQEQCRMYSQIWYPNHET